MNVRIGMAQILVEPGFPEANLVRAEQAVAVAARAGARIVVLPETMDLGWNDDSAFQLAEPIPGPRTERLGRLARTHGLYLAAGLTERAPGTGDAERPVIHNAAVLLDPNGRILLHHRKIHELALARRIYTPGTWLSVASTEWGPIGLNICADNLQETLALGRAQGLMGARMLLSPSAWAVSPNHDESLTPYGSEWIKPYRALAREFDMPVVGVSYVSEPMRSGEWVGWPCIGRSLAVSRDGTIAAWGRYGSTAAEVLTVDLDLGSGRASATA